MNRLYELLGREHELDYVNRTLRDFAQEQRATAVGAMHVTCSDECEREAVESFQHWFAEQLLPELKFWSKAPFRSANLGGRYEWGSVGIAENHFATPDTAQGFKLLVIKIHSHVAVVQETGETRYGRMDRYDAESAFCGALHAVLDGHRYPALDDITEAFAAESMPRLDMLRDPETVDPAHRSLLAAVVAARLQARRAMIDVQDHVPATPTLYAILPCVTLNRKQRDTEFVVGVYLADRRGGGTRDEYRGLESDPSKYRVADRHGLLCIEDEHLTQPREARNHRQEVLRIWQQRRGQKTRRDKRLDDVIRQVRSGKHHDVKLSHEMLKTLLWVLLDVSPIPTSILLFTKGAAGIHHLYRVHRLARGEEDLQAAKSVVEDFQSKVDQLPPDAARDVIDALLENDPSDSLHDSKTA